ncbi:hypothetical protein SFRURICE_009404 [Spodoptera frugiperda]|nr:hypothetical protein SFRURICE_009404 [Spodoptera frugiperda]
MVMCQVVYEELMERRGEAGGAMACAGCEKPILDKFLLHVLERAWHAACVRCADCRAPLADKCYSRDNKLFCRNDFFSWDPVGLMPDPVLQTT